MCTRKENKRKTPRRKMTELYDLFNTTYIDFIKQLSKTFVDIPKLQKENAWVTRVIHEQGKQTDMIYKRVHEGMHGKFIESIHKKDVNIFRRDFTTDRIVLFEHACLYDIYPRMGPQERDALWECLICLAQHLSILNGSVRNMASFSKIAHSFLAKNPNIQEQNVQQQLFTQLFSNPDLANEARKMFVEQDVNLMRNDLVEIVRGAGLTVPKQATSATVEEIDTEDEKEDGDKHDEETKETKSNEQQAGNPSTAAQPDALQQLFASMRSKDKAIAKKAAKKFKNRKNPVAEMVEYMERQPLDDAKIEETRDIANRVLGGKDGDPKARERMQQLFNTFGQTMNNGSIASGEDIMSKLSSCCLEIDEEMKTQPKNEPAKPVTPKTPPSN